jgi:hypothetical protein
MKVDYAEPMKTLDRAVFVVLALALATVAALVVAQGVSVELAVAYVWLVALFAEWNDDWAGMRRILAQWRRLAAPAVGAIDYWWSEVLFPRDPRRR